MAEEGRIWDARALRDLAAQAATEPCTSCATLPTTGWETVPVSLDRQRMEPLGTLYDPQAGNPLEATLEEYHPHGTRYWSAEAPIAPAWFPYNRCGVWRCTACATVFLRYAEHGGYFEEERIRRVVPALVDLTAPPPGNT
nr:hypothetical protein [Variovorax boronicumulans]